MIQVLIGSLAIIALQPSLAAESVAIKCTGTMKISPHSKQKPGTTPQIRTFILTPTAKDISFWSPSFGKAFGFCEDWKGDCSLDFYPNVIMGHASGEGMNVKEIVVDRKAGTLWELDNDVLQMTEYSSTCIPTALPAADTTKNRF